MKNHYKVSVCLIAMSLCGVPQASAQSFNAKTEHVLASDGPDNGLDSYTLIRNTFGKKAIEAPDLYPDNHPGLPHIIEENDDIVGNHFVFLSHLDDDKDRDKKKLDRQRNEIKVYDYSNTELRAYEDETMQYRWKFKIDSDFEFSKSFTHFFQIKGKNKKNTPQNGGDSYPILTLTMVDRGDEGNEFQFRHNAGYDKDKKNTDMRKLIRKSTSLIADQWVEIFVQMTFSEEGTLLFQIKNIETGELVVDFKEDGLDLWRGESEEDFARPKWGIYRSLKDTDRLRSEQERARFADFTITKGELK